ncbi:ATP-binding protein [Leisingera sp. D0M16]|uniref:ATP-binding protein n=1 Tax=Leisingera coralii TaxID=3351347 RepID=UPI003B7B1AEA
MKLKTKFALSVFCVMGFSLSLFFTVDHLSARQRVQKLITQQVLSNDHIYSHNAAEVFAGLEMDLNAFSSFPAISSIVRSYSSSDQLDPVSGLTLEKPREQVEQVSADLITGPRLRLLLNDGSRHEFVRAIARDGLAEVVLAHALQSKAEEPYLQDVSQRAGENSFCYSHLTLNREHGQVSGSPAIRIFHPVLDAEGAVFGAVAVNTSADMLVTDARPDIASHYTFYLVSNLPPAPNGSAGESMFLFHSDPGRQPLKPQGIKAAPENILERFGEAGGAFFTRTVPAPPGSPPFQIKLVTLANLDRLLATALRELKRDILAAGMLRNHAMRMERRLKDLVQHSRIGRVTTPEISATGAEIQVEILVLPDVPSGMKVHLSSRFRDLLVRKLPLQTILLALFANGIKHNGKAEGNVWGDATVEDTVCTFSVRDDGPGVAVQYRSNIFETFQTLEPKDHGESCGTGLAFVKKHLEVAGAEISVQSDGATGTCFRFTWPQDDLQKENAA